MNDEPDFRQMAQDVAGVEALIQEFNQRYAVVNESGKAVIYGWSHDEQRKRLRYDRIGFPDFSRLWMNRTIVVGRDEQDREVRKPVSSVWLRHPDRRQYIDGVVFDPSGNAAKNGSFLNLWRGFAIKPAKGDWSLLRAHIRSIVCRDVKEHFDYLMGWMAGLVQCPAQSGEVAVVLKGEEGTGKGTLGNALKHIIGQHAIAVSNARHLVGNFNGHLRDCIFLFADEAFFAGDKAHVGVLKALITEETLTIEGKGRDVIDSPNYLHIMMASNEAWVIPAGLEARRFFVLEVDDACRGAHTYFAEIRKQLENGGYEAMLHDLLNYDLSKFNVRDVPKTEALQEQKHLSVPTSIAWCRAILERGYVWESRLGLEKVFGEWHERVSTQLLFKSYTEFHKDRRDRQPPMHLGAFGKFLTSFGWRHCTGRQIALGEALVSVEGFDGRKTREAQVVAVSGSRPAYDLGPLEQARADFTRVTGLSIASVPSDDEESTEGYPAKGSPLAPHSITSTVTH